MQKIRSKNDLYSDHSAWIKDWEHKLMIKITRRVELVSGLKAFQPKEAEDYQVINRKMRESESYSRRLNEDKMISCLI